MARHYPIPVSKKEGQTIKEPLRNKLPEQEKTLFFKNGRTYFTKEAEKKFYFGLTIIMLLLGILSKVGLF